MKLSAKVLHAGLMGFSLCMAGNVMAANSPEPGSACPDPGIPVQDVGPPIKATMVFYTTSDGTQFDAQLKRENEQWELYGAVSILTVEDVPLDVITKDNLEAYSLFSIPPAPPADPGQLICVMISKVKDMTIMTNVRIAEVKIEQVEPKPPKPPKPPKK